VGFVAETTKAFQKEAGTEGTICIVPVGERCDAVAEFGAGVTRVL
jgi:hypothetical protein